jgi:hypothetical protein
MDDLLQSPEFLALVGRITGIAGLRYDPWYFGGGTHENRQGQDLDPHIDFNYHPMTRQHRRLNLIIYLNEEWDDAWGGSLQLHRDPHLEPAEDQIVTVTPLLNDVSWDQRAPRGFSASICRRAARPVAQVLRGHFYADMRRSNAAEH